MTIEARLDELFSLLTRSVTQSSLATIGAVRVGYYHNGAHPECILPLLQLGRVLAHPPITTAGRDDTLLSFYVVQDADIFEHVHQQLAAPLSSVARPIPPAPRLSTLGQPPGRRYCVLQFAADADFARPYAYFLHIPSTRDSAIVLREMGRRSHYTVTETVLDVFLASCDLFGFHGSAVAYNGAGMIFLGAAGAGKTSLTLGFVRLGAKFLSDDISLLTPAGLLLPFEQKRLTLRPHMVAYLARHGLMAETRWVGPRGERRSPDVYGYMSEIFDHSVYGAPAPLRAIVLPTYRPEIEAPRLMPLQPPAAIKAAKPALLPWIMQWGEAYELTGKSATVERVLDGMLRTHGVCAWQLDYGLDTDAAVRTVALCVASSPVGTA